jgi:hypothetical protein
MQISHLVTIASAAIVQAKVYNDNSPIPASVSSPSDTVAVPADSFGTAVGAASARLHSKDLVQAQAFDILMCEHTNFLGQCLTITGIEHGVCCKFISRFYALKSCPECVLYIAVSNQGTDILSTEWNDRISSTDTRGHTCTVFEHAGCEGDQSTINGRYNWGHMNDRITSYRCFE